MTIGQQLSRAFWIITGVAIFGAGVLAWVQDRSLVGAVCGTTLGLLLLLIATRATDKAER